MSQINRRMKLNLSNKIGRKKFFGILGLGTVAAFTFSSFKFGIFSSTVKRMERKNVKVAIHPSAVKRINKV
jgi:hypothetical protein